MAYPSQFLHMIRSTPKPEQVWKSWTVVDWCMMTSSVIESIVGWSTKHNHECSSGSAVIITVGKFPTHIPLHRIFEDNHGHTLGPLIPHYIVQELQHHGCVNDHEVHSCSYLQQREQPQRGCPLPRRLILQSNPN